MLTVSAGGGVANDPFAGKAIASRAEALDLRNAPDGVCYCPAIFARLGRFGASGKGQAQPVAVRGGTHETLSIDRTGRQTDRGRSLGALGASALVSEVAAQTKKTIAWIPKATNSTFWLAVKRGAEKAGGELGYDILYVGVQDQTNIAGQVNLVNDMVTRKVAGILIAATDAKALAPAVDKAIAAGVPTITLDFRRRFRQAVRIYRD